MSNVSSSNGLGKYPKLRFKGFSDPWNNISFRELFTFLPNNTLSRAELNYESGEYQNVHYGDVLIKFGPVLDAATDVLPFITEYNDKNAHKQLLQSGDVIIADTAEDEAVGKATEIINVATRKVVSGLHTIACRPRVEMTPTYLGFYINSEIYHQQLYSLMQGVKVLSISKSNIEGTTLRYPTEAEQQKICALLNLIELKIVKQKKLIELLKKYKRGLLQRILRHDNEWEEVSLSEVLFERKTYCEKDGTYEHATLSKEGVYGKTDRYDRDYLVMDEEKKYKITHFGDLCYNPANLKFGVICLNTYGDAIFSPIYITFEIADEYNKEFIGLLLTRADFINRALKYQQGTVYERMAVSPEDLLTMKIKVPPLETQNRIAHIFTEWDALIRKNESVLEGLQNGKKQLLNSLFI